MEQMKMDGLEVIPLDYQTPGLPVTFRKLKPAVYKDGDSFCCLLGPDPQEGVFGSGKTQDEAILDWTIHLKNRVIDHPYGDEVSEFVIAKLSESTGDS